ncbi:MAG: biotin/lipoyl-containing protein, partial [Sedimenticolaceae bacterium]
GATSVPAPLAGNIFRVNVAAGQVVNSGDVIMILEAMKMETEVRSPDSGTVQAVLVKEGDAVQVGDILLTLS